jgi:hypothetical protein
MGKLIPWSFEKIRSGEQIQPPTFTNVAAVMAAEGGLFYGRELDQFLDLAKGSEISQRLTVTVRQERHWGS